MSARRFHWLTRICLIAAGFLLLPACKRIAPAPPSGFDQFVLNYETPADPVLQAHLESIDAAARARHGLGPEHAAAGVIDLRNPRVAMIHPDRITYAATNYDALNGADALVIVTDWNEYRHPDFIRIKDTLRKPIVIDGRNLYSPEKLAKLGFTYRSFGRSTA